MATRKPEVRFEPALVIESFTALCNRLDAIREGYTSSANETSDTRAMGESIAAVVDFLTSAVPEALELGDVLVDAAHRLVEQSAPWEMRIILCCALATLSVKDGKLSEVCSAIEKEFLADKNIPFPGHKTGHGRERAKDRLLNYRKRLLRQHPQKRDWRRQLYENTISSARRHGGADAADYLQALMRIDYFSQPSPTKHKG